MKMTIRELRSLIKREVSRLVENSGAWRVKYLEKDGRTPGTKIFAGPTAERLATMYAKSVKNGVAEPADDVADVAAPTVTVADKPATIDDLKASAKRYRQQHWQPSQFLDTPGKWQKPDEDDYSDENRSEREREFFASATASGASYDAIMSDLNDMRTSCRRTGRRR